MRTQNVFALAKHESIDHGSLGMRNHHSIVHKTELILLRLDALTRRLAKLEEASTKETIDYPTSHATSSTSSSPSANNRMSINEVLERQKRYRVHEPHDAAPVQSPASKRRKSGTVAQQHVHQAHSPGSTHHVSEAKEYIEHELQCNPSLSEDRRTALESARKFVGQLSNPTLQWEGTAATDEMDVQESLGPPTLSPELLYMMLPGPDKITSPHGTVSWPDHISDKTLEQMGLAIIEGTEPEQVLQHYRMTVWVKAICCISKTGPLITSEALRIHFRTLKKRYEASAAEILNQLPLAAAPSLLLLQSILSAARFMQYRGNMSRCWMLTALASRMIVALNYHNITTVLPRTEIEENICACVYTCYHFDKTLSLLLLRPPSLPDLKVRPVQLIHMDPDIPTSSMVKGMVEYSELKNELLDILLDTKAIGDAEKANILSDLVARAHAIHSNMQTVREEVFEPFTKHPLIRIIGQYRRRQEQQFAQSWSHLRREWLAMDFNYYSVLTTIIQARSSVLKSRLVCENSREALTTLRALHEAFSSHLNTIDAYPYFLTWTMLLFPLAPFFALFCNVIATSNERDFDMIKNITDDLRQFAQANASIGKLYKLFSLFLDLCAPLVKGMSGGVRSEQPAAALSVGDMAGNPEGRVGSYLPSIIRVTERDIASLRGADTTGNPTATRSVEGWDDSLVWELFDNQPSLGWAESELWSMTQFDDTQNVDV
ncbi:hypothetical protein N7535_007455 [Penicillium sp. DV-2018c]|nr:hypothetical protein N7461_003483 [Penicillium sp. DV-2018c]KAJ5565817.1 hypothetical protein N7535_007455 [Penicillium sp. DV-2018c]